MMKKRILFLLVTVVVLLAVTMVSFNAEATEATCPHCNTAMSKITWNDWAGTSGDFNTDGHYRLTGTYNQSGQIKITGGDVVIDLAGHTLTTSTGRPFYVNGGTLSLLDSSEGKTAAVEGKATASGAVLFVNASGTLHIYGGTYESAATTGKDGGTIAIIGNVTLHDGIIKGSTSTAAGGCLQLSKGSFTMNGGTLTAGTATTSGGTIFAKGGTLNLNGGTIEAGTVGSGKSGTSVFAYTAETTTPCTVNIGSVNVPNADRNSFVIGGNTTVNISDAPKIGYLSSTSALTIGEMTDGASVYLATSNSISLTSENAQLGAYLEKGYLKAYAAGTVLTTNGTSLTTADYDCPCCTTAPADIVWTAWDGTMEDGAHYYLARDLVLTAQVNLPANTNITLDLHGKKITADSSRSFIIYGGLDVVDSGVTGQIVSGMANTNGGVFSVQETGNLELHGGTYIANAAPGKGSVAYVIGSMTIHEGVTLDGSNAQDDSKTCSTVYTKGVFNMDGGTIIGGTAKRGGSIFVEAGTLSITGGTVSGGASNATDGSGDDIYVQSATEVTLADCSVSDEAHINAATTVTIAGDVVLTRLKLNEGVLLTLGELTANADVAVAVSDDTFTVENANAAAYLEAGYIKSANADQIFVAVNNVIKVLASNAPKCAHCGEYIELINWLPFSAASVKSTGGHYYLTAEVSRTLQLQIDAGVDSVIDLRDNNFTVTKADTRAFLVYGTLTVMDTVGEGVVTGLGNGNGGVYNVQSGAELYLHGGTSTAGTDAACGSVVYLEGAALTVDGSAVLNGNSKTGSTIYANVKDGNGSTVTINAGTVRTGKALGFGGNVYVSDKSQLTIAGGVVGGGEADVDADGKNGLGGNIYLAPGATATLSSGNVQNGKSSSYGGNIAIADGASMEITGGYVRGGTANLGGKLTAFCGDNVYMEGELTVSQGTFALNNTDQLGNAILARGTAVLNLQGPAKNYNTDFSGNVHMLSTCTLNAEFGVQMIYRYGRIGWYKTVAEAIEDFGNHENHRYVKLLFPEDVTVTKDLRLDINGMQINATVNDGCTLSSIDSSATLEAVGTGSVTASGAGVVATETDLDTMGRYVALTENGVTTFHKFEMAVTTVSLRPSAMGFYYKAKCTCDPILAAAVDTYGVVLSVNNMPGKDFVTETGDINKYTVMDGNTFVSGKVITSGAVFDIMRNDLSAETNRIRGEKKIYANAYVNFRIDDENVETIISDTKNPGLKDGNTDFDGIGYSMYDIMAKLNEKYSDLTEAQLTSVKGFHGTWYSKGMSVWSLINLSNISVGFGRSNITPDFNVYISGGSVPDRISTGVKDELFLTCIAVTDETGATALLITQDLINAVIGYATRQLIAQETGVPFKNIMIAATHTHSAPGTAGDHQGVPEYQTLYYEAAVAAAKAALEDRAPALAQTGSATARTENNNQLVFVRRYKQQDGGYRGGVGNNTNSALVSHAYDANETMQVIKFIRGGNKKDILLTNLGAHATFNGATTMTSLSADFPGAIRDYIETNSDYLSAHFISGAADQNPKTELAWEDHGLDYVAYGQAIAKVALGTTLSNVETGNVTFASKVVTVDSNKLNVDADTLAKAEEANAVFLASGFAAGEAKAIELGFIGIYHARSFISRSALEDTQSIGINALAIGNLSFVFAPYEMFGSNAAALVAGSPYQNTFVVSCANDSKGYVPADIAYDMGCYESYTARVARGSAETLVEEFLALLNTLHG